MFIIQTNACFRIQTAGTVEPGQKEVSQEEHVRSSDSFLAEISVRSPKKTIIFIILNKSFMGHSIQTNILFILKTEQLVGSLQWRYAVGR